MFRFLNKIMRMGSLKGKAGPSSGQVAIILILVIAAALIFYAVSLNLGQFALSRTVVTIASNSGASMLASDLASYGEQLSMGSLKGQDELCGTTSILSLFISILVIVAVIVVGVASGGAAFLGTWQGVLALIGLALATVSVVIQATVIQPGFSDQWNSIIQKTLSTRNQFTEGAVQTGLIKAVTDSMQIPDLYDGDRDGVWQNPGSIQRPYEDTVGRFGLYYSQRIRQIKEPVKIGAIEVFIADLEEFLYEKDDGWGIFDPMPRSACLGRAECHGCCMPNRVDSWALDGLRPRDCRDHTDAEWAAACEAASPYQNGGNGYPWLFDSYFENPNNGFFSFREQIGRDDENRTFYKDPSDPNSEPVGGTPSRQSQILHAAGQEGFRLEDTTGFYVPPYYPLGVEDRWGIYPFFYKMADWGVDLEAAAADIAAHSTTTAADTGSRECHWCDPRDTVNCRTCAGLPPHPHPVEIPQLALPLDPALPANGITYNTTYFVDGFDPGAVTSNPPLAVDKITVGRTGSIVAEYPLTAEYDSAVPPPQLAPPSDVCAQDSLHPFPDLTIGFWRRGGDKFCSAAFPYDMDCFKCGGDDCECGPDDPANFPDDPIDDIVYGLTYFIEWAERLMDEADSSLQEMTDNFPGWYEEAATWIEPAPDNLFGAPCFLCAGLSIPTDPPTPIREGGLWIFLREMWEIRARLYGWINNMDNTGINHGYAGDTCTDVWCVPNAALNCGEVPDGNPANPGDAISDEKATFNTHRTFDATDVQGDVADIVGCLNYNVNGYDHVAAEAFKRCLNLCGAAQCTVGVNLPVFHLDGITPYEYPPAAPLNCAGWAAGNEWFEAITRNVALAVNPSVAAVSRGNDIRFQNCANSCSLEDCNRLPRSLVPFALAPLYFPQNYVPWDSAIGAVMDPVLADANWKDLTAFNDCLNICSVQNCAVGPRLPTVHSSDGITPFAYPGVPLSCVGWGGGNIWYDAVLANKNSIVNAVLPLEQHVPAMARCFNDCVTNLADCQSMSTDPAFTWTTAPAGFLPADCDGAGLRHPLGVWRTEIINNAIVAGGPSCNPDPDPATNPNPWLANTRQSAIEAQNQVAKFRKRRDFLGRRLAEIQGILDILGEDLDGDGLTDGGAIEKFERFLFAPGPGGIPAPAVAIIQARIDYVSPPSFDRGLPYQAIYGWRDKGDPETQEWLSGKWHIVKVEARIPGMCDQACSLSQNPSDGDPSWPRIDTKTSRWGTKRCFFMTKTDGVVKFRVTRWDENKTSDFMRFAGGAPLWRFRSDNPARAAVSADPDDIEGSACRLFANETSGININASGLHFPSILLGGHDEVLSDYTGAFIMNQRVESSVDPLNPPNGTCWDLAQRLLSTGVVKETCAKYYWHEGGLQGMGFQFTPCTYPF